MKLNQRIYKTFRDSKVNLSSFLQEFKQSIKVMDTSTNVDDTAEACHRDHAQWWPVATRYCTSTIYELDIGYKQGRFEGTRWRRRDSETLETGSPFWCSPNISPSWLLLVTCVQVLCWCPGDTTCIPWARGHLASLPITNMLQFSAFLYSGSLFTHTGSADSTAHSGQNKYLEIQIRWKRYILQHNMASPNLTWE